MVFNDFKDPISIIHTIQTLLYESIEEFKIRQSKTNIVPSIFINESDVSIEKLIEKKLLLLDIALINLKIEEEEKYFRFKDIIVKLDKDIEAYYKLTQQDSPFPISPPKTIKNHVRDLQVFQFLPKLKTKESSNHLDQIEVISEIELTRIKDKVAMLIELGIIDHLIIKYSYLDNNALRLTKLLSAFLDIKVDSLKKIINAFITDQKSKTDYPKITDTVKNAIDKLTLEK
ncbi:MAG: hypothetical protein NTX34_08810 [Cytophagales bacterium]|nr:hypothetical protein [Cytophagales bacterium]